MLKPCPVTVVTFPPERLPASGAAMSVGAPRIERQGGPVIGTDPTVRREQRFRRRDRWHAGEDGGRALAEVRQQRLQVGGSRDLLAACGQLFRRHHARTPSPAQRTGSTVAPAAHAAATAGWDGSCVTKNIEPPAPAPAALPPSAPAARIAASSRAISGVLIAGSSRCWWRQFSESNVATRATSPARRASAMAAAPSFIARSAPVTPASPRSYAAITRAIVAPDTRERPV